MSSVVNPKADAISQQAQGELKPSMMFPYTESDVNVQQTATVVCVFQFPCSVGRDAARYASQVFKVFKRQVDLCL